ncbi:hypothetical protein QAD02_015558 [Eretmocerus hayati]|uniref:Uncharacterized protein n=1 Tax=Eretmocerus hayati TaxID=131215 RepID=A0ACC2P9V6_9HYME|nr:hypothetical protein QAD02_015558 [Eretmocerus hayati]
MHEIMQSTKSGTISLTKRIDEVRLLESRKSARLADTDTDFARLADMGSDRKRASSNSIDVPHVIGSRKRRPSSSNDSERSYNGNQLAESGSYMDECSAAMVLMSLSTPPKNPLPIHCQQHYGSWDDGVSTSSNRVVVGSPGVGGTSNSSSSSSTSSGASYRSGTPSPPLSDEGNIRCRVNYDDCRDSPNAGSSSDNEVKPMTIYRCTWRTGENRNIRCGETGSTWEVVAEHVLRTHLNGQNTAEHEEDFYIVDEQLEPACSPPTKSHWDMVRPRSEDPEYQKQLRLAASPNQNTPMNTNSNAQDIIIRDVFSIASQNSPSKQFKPAPRPALQPYNPQNISVVTVSLGKMPHSPRRVRGETKKCRKVYGMEHKELWCTQCKWKKACTRFND